MTTVAIAGADGALGSRVRARLAGHADVQAVRHLPVDLADVLPDHLAEVDVVVNLDADATADGLHALLDAVVDAGVGAVVHLSSVTVYGAHPDNPVPMPEEQSLRAMPDHDAGQRHAAMEGVLQAWTPQHRDIPVAVLRSAMVVGGDERPWLIDVFVGARVLGVRGHRPPLQFLHLDDLASAVTHATVQRLSGAYNVAAEGWLSADEVDAILGRRRLEVPEGMVHNADHLMHPCVMAVDRLVATGWWPEQSNRDAVAVLAAQYGEQVVLGPVVATRGEVRQAAGVAAGVTGGLLALGLLARRRRRSGRDEA